MQISNTHIDKVLELHLHKVYATNSVAISRNPGGPDELVLSTRASEISRIKQSIADMPQTRAELAQTLRQQVESGTYEIDPRSLAQAMLASGGPYPTIN